MDPFAAVVPTEASTSGELISEPSEIGAPAEEVQSESASESATVREPIETNAPNEIVQIGSIQNNCAHIQSTIKGFLTFQFTYHSSTVEIFPKQSDGLQIECYDGICTGRITDNPENAHEFQYDVHFLNQSDEPIRIQFIGMKQDTNIVRRSITLVPPQSYIFPQHEDVNRSTNTTPQIQPSSNIIVGRASKEELEEIAQRTIEQMKRESERIEWENN